MKTDHDLLEEFTRYLFEGCGASGPALELKMHEWRNQLIGNMRTKPPKSLTDQEYEATLQQLKNEAPAYLHYLLNTDFPDLPGKFRGENN